MLLILPALFIFINNNQFESDSYALLLFGLLIVIYSLGLIYLPRYDRDSYRLILKDEGAFFADEEVFKYSDVVSVELRRMCFDRLVLVKTRLEIIEIVPWTRNEILLLLNQIARRTTLSPTDFRTENIRYTDFYSMDISNFNSEKTIDSIMDKIHFKFVLTLIIILFITTEYRSIKELYYKIFNPAIAGVVWPRSSRFYSVDFDEPNLITIQEPFLFSGVEWPEGSHFSIDSIGGDPASIDVKASRNFNFLNFVWEKSCTITIQGKEMIIRSPKEVQLGGQNYPRRSYFYFEDGRLKRVVSKIGVRSF